MTTKGLMIWYLCSDAIIKITTHVYVLYFKRTIVFGVYIFLIVGYLLGIQHTSIKMHKAKLHRSDVKRFFGDEM